MTLLRALPRAMLASYFVASGIKAIRDPESLVPVAEPLADRVVPLVKQYAPEQLAGAVPDNTVTLVRVFGVAQVAGGVALATGRGRRLGALLLAGTLVPGNIAKHPFWKVQDPEERAQDRKQFLKNVSLLGGVLLASVDTEGKPSLAWRAQKGGEAFAKGTRRASKKLTKRTDKVAGGASDLAESAVVTATALAAALSDSSRKVQKRAARQLKEAKAVAASQAEEAQEAAAKAAKKVKKEAKKQVKVVKRKAKEIGENVQLGYN
jgi:uncharacterized membrane protein YphA (DoxX/SURF4 family)